MDRKDKEPKGATATASKMAANKKQTGGESTSPEQQNQGSGGQYSRNTGMQSSPNIAAQPQQPSFNTNISGAQQPSPPSNPAL